MIGCRLTGRLPEGATATDLALTVTQTLRAKGVVQKFVEFCGDGLDTLTLTDRATVSNMSPEYGATMGFFPVDKETLAYLDGTGRDADQIALVEAYTKAQGMWRETGARSRLYRRGRDRPGPSGDQPRGTVASQSTHAAVAGAVQLPGRAGRRRGRGCVGRSRRGAGSELHARPWRGRHRRDHELHQHLESGRADRRRATGAQGGRKGPAPKPWVKTSLAPGSRIVGDYLAASGLQKDLDALGYQIVGYGCMTCMGASGPLDEAIETAIRDNNLVAGAVLSGNRNFEARIHPMCRVNYLASPPLVVAYALAGRLDINLHEEPLGEDKDGNPVMLADIWPSGAEIQKFINETVTAERFSDGYAHILEGGPEWDALETGGGVTFDWDAASTYLRRPPYFVETERAPEPVTDITGARALIMAGDMTTTDHISPVSVIGADSSGRRIPDRPGRPSAGLQQLHDPARQPRSDDPRHLREHPLQERAGAGHGGRGHASRAERRTDVGVRRGHEVPREGVPLVVIGAKEYGTGSSRDWAAKGTHLLGIRAVIAEGLERIHRSNLIGMGVLPLQFKDGATRKTLALDGSETFDITGLENGVTPGMDVACRITRADGTTEGHHAAMPPRHPGRGRLLHPRRHAALCAAAGARRSGLKVGPLHHRA